MPISPGTRRRSRGACASSTGNWDIERALEANAAGVSLLGLMLAITVDRKWLALPAAVAGFLMQHALQGWCPPIELFRRLGVRTAREIARERYALKALRGDFASVSGSDEERATAALRAVAMPAARRS
ncbi:MAG: hypothetical protein ACXW25_08545 [Rhodospirillales bacterium]